MAKNPSLSKADCNYHSGLVNQDSINNPKTTNLESYNTFDRSNIRYTTQKFDSIHPVYMKPAIEGDHIRVRTRQDLRTYTLNSPLLSPVKMSRSFYQIPFSAIMPNTWEYLVRTPVQGEDILYTDVAPLISYNQFRFLVYGLDCFPESASSSASASLLLRQLFLAFMLVDSLFSESGLPKLLGLTVPVSGQQKQTFADIESDFLSAVVETLVSAAGSNNVILQLLVSDDNVIRLNVASDLTPRMFYNYLMECFRADYAFGNSGFTGLSSEVAISFYESVSGYYKDFITSVEGLLLEPLVEDKYINLMPLIAYQLVCAQYYTNSHIDAVYTAKMWQQNALSFAFSVFNSTHSFYFDYNGIKVPYDAYSAFIVESILSLFDGTPDNCYLVCEYFWNLFVIPASLRYGDYFTSGRKRPLAVGDVSVSVDGSSTSGYSVSAINVNESLWMQRFLNAVNRTRQNIYDYLYSITGIRPAREEPRPNFICNEVFNLNGQEVENTSEDQGNIVTLLRNGESRFMFDIIIDEPSFVIGVDTFSVDYAYPDATDKVYFMEDRLDWFNHFMQHIGDQTIEMRELQKIVDADVDTVFAYQLRYAQYKFGISHSDGGFNDGSLPSWALLYDSRRYYVNEPRVSQIYIQGPIDSTFIRNHNFEFDKLYKSLTNATSSSRYFHFIKSIYFVDYDNSRQQAYPSLL